MVIVNHKRNGLSIFESCNCAQEVRRRAIHNVGSFGLGLTPNLFPVPLPLPISKRPQGPLKGESYESSIYNRRATGVGNPGHGTERLRSRVQSTDEFRRARSGQETDRGKGILSQVFRSPEKPVDKTPETGRPVWLGDHRLPHLCLYLAVFAHAVQKP